MNATVKDVMTTHVVAVREAASFKEMAARLREQRVSAFPVLDSGNKVVGVVSEADLLTKEALDYAGPHRVSGILHHGVLHHSVLHHSVLNHGEQAKATGTTAADLMTKPAVTVGPAEFVTRAARLMYERKVKRLPVVDDDGRLIGIVSRADVLSVYSRPDGEIRREITEGIILDTLLCDPARFAVTVKDGIVTVEGTPETAVVGHDLIAEIRHVEGVVAVRDRLSYPRAQRPVPGPGPLL